jgi:LacI family transcriptional regulator
MPETSTLREVAKRAGVSISTASQALNNRPNVAPETRARVLEAAASLGYQQQIRIPSPITTQLSVIGLLTRTTPDGSMPVNPFYSYVLAGAERECQRYNLSLMYTNVEVDNLNRPLSLPTMLHDNLVDGILVVGSLLETLEQPPTDLSRKPIVLVDAYAPGQRFDSVVSDNLNGVYNAVSYLIDHGHRHIGLVGSMADDYPSIRERRKGYVRALKHRNIPDVYIEDSPLTRSGGYDATGRLLRHNPQITAIFACNDIVALGALDAAHDLGRDVPGDLSVIGFDDIDLARAIKPALTTVQVDKMLMGAMAVRHLVERASEPNRTTITTTLSTRLIVRDTVRAIP